MQGGDSQICFAIVQGSDLFCGGARRTRIAAVQEDSDKLRGGARRRSDLLRDHRGASRLSDIVSRRFAVAQTSIRNGIVGAAALRAGTRLALVATTLVALGGGGVVRGCSRLTAAAR
ncbi:hypothetical protein VNO80_13315 [Phaseolus coccineus]|uniref:Uncharacterized protein n=1 Tax=Phaseolus coccineus TaxID=3886 RepID=A0AAN9RFH9_PHACN